jgi:plastocyanin
MARRLLSAVLLLLSIGTASVALAQTGDTASRFAVSVDARLALVGTGTPIKDFSQVVVWLTSVEHPVVAPEQHFRVVQRNKKFEPNFLVVPQGSTVDFPNLDPWFHNVFSQFRGKRFDLGLYQAGSQRSVKFDMAGVSYLFCNIHPNMSGIIVALDSNFYGVTDKLGHARIANLPAGKYSVHLWYRDATPEALAAVERTVDVDQDRALGTITLQVKPQSREPHKNKYGHDYEPTPLSPEY